MNSSDYEIAVIGAGIHGAGIAQAAAARGHSVLVVEKSAVAAGTSSRSSKLIHGGLRYLESGQLTLVRESLRERAILTRIAPDLVHWIPFHIPVYDDSRRGPLAIRAGLSLYAILGGLHERCRFETLPRGDWSTLDGIKTDRLRAVFRYWDAQTDDALLTEAVIRSAEGLGAKLFCPAELLAAEAAGGGYRLRLLRGEREEVVTASVLVNAAGPWINEVLKRVRPAARLFDLEWAQGAHVMFEEPIARGIYYVEAPSDRRAVFIMPWKGKTLVGTTETRFAGDPDGVKPLPEEVEYLASVYKNYFPSRAREVIGEFAGLRVLPRGGSSLNRARRDTQFIVEPARAPRLLTLAGGKLTAYRSTAEKVMKLIAPSLPPARSIARTDEIPLERPASAPESARSSAPWSAPA